MLVAITAGLPRLVDSVYHVVTQEESDQLRMQSLLLEFDSARGDHGWQAERDQDIPRGHLIPVFEDDEQGPIGGAGGDGDSDVEELAMPPEE